MLVIRGNGRVVDICTGTAQKELIGPGLLAIGTPLFVGKELIDPGRTFILSPGPKSLSAFTLGLLVISSLGMSFKAPTPRTSIGVPAVFAHSVMSDGTPPVPKSRPPERSASFIAPGPPSLAQVTLTSPRPACFACFSISFWSCMIIKAR